MDGMSNGYTLITIHELKPWVFLAFLILPNAMSRDGHSLLIMMGVCE